MFMTRDTRLHLMMHTNNNRTAIFVLTKRSRQLCPTHLFPSWNIFISLGTSYRIQLIQSQTRTIFEVIVCIADSGGLVFWPRLELDTSLDLKKIADIPTHSSLYYSNNALLIRIYTISSLDRSKPPQIFFIFSCH